MPKDYFSRYKSPNIVIIPAPLCYPPSPKRQKAEKEMRSPSPQHVDLSFLDDFNIDEIVECLNNCDDNDSKVQETSDFNDKPEELVETNENKVTISCSENQLNINDNDQKFDTIELESTKKSDITLNNKENEIQNKITNILDNNTSDQITETNTLASDNFNTQSDSTAVENNVKSTTCTEVKITETNTLASDNFNTQSDSTAVENNVKSTTCTEVKITETNTLASDNFNTQSDSTAVENNIKSTTCTEVKITETNTLASDNFNTQSDSTAAENNIKSTTCTEVKITETNTLASDNFNTQSDSTAVENNIKSTTCTEVKITETNTLASDNFNTQSDSTAVENNIKSTTCTEVKIIEKDTERDITDQTKPLHNVNKNEHTIINSKDCQDTKVFLTNKPNITKTDNNNESQDKSINLTLKNTKNIVIPVVDIKSKVQHEDKEFMKESTTSTTSLKSVVCKTYTNLYRKLEIRMFDYLCKSYTVELLVHNGKFSKILKCKDSTGKQYAIKMLNKQSDRFCLGINKDKMLMRMQADIPKENLFLVYCLKSFSFNGYWCFLMDFYPKNLKQALEELSKPFHIDLVQELARQLVAAVTLLRNNNIVHSDIKPSHILLNSSQNCLKLCGFDSTYYIGEAFIKPDIGSLNYRPPEIILGYSAGFSIDVWCTALVLYEMTTGTQLFPGDSNLDILNKQISTIDNIPPDMLSNSRYTSRYFIGGIFRKRLYFKEEAIFTNNFYKYKKLYKTVYAAYYNNWASSRTKIQISNDLIKMKSLLKLLKQMLTIHPKYRITIEFVYANPFVYEMYDC